MCLLSPATDPGGRHSVKLTASSWNIGGCSLIARTLNQVVSSRTNTSVCARRRDWDGASHNLRLIRSHEIAQTPLKSLPNSALEGEDLNLRT